MNNLTKVREKVDQLNIIDDTLFHKMAEDIGFCEEMISTIMEQKVKVLQVIPQGSIKNLQGRSVVVDALCELEDGTVSDVEVQKSNNDNHQKRARYNASCITANITDPGTKFEKVPDVVIIYISKFDMFKENKTVYHVNRTVQETGETVYNGLTEIYVNTKVDDGSDIAELMKIFTEIDAYDYQKFPKTSSRKALFKTSEEEAETMCDIVEEYARECAEEAVKRIAKKLLDSGMPVDKVVELTEVLTLEDIKTLAGMDSAI